MGTPKIQILRKQSEIIPFSDTVKEMAESDRTAFGFLAESFYYEAAICEKLIVAVNTQDQSYTGHLIFGGVYPNGRVFQVFVEPTYRKQGVATLLFKALFGILNSRQFAQVQARVASDLSAANHLYERMGFATRKMVDGGKTTGRKINLKVKELNAPTLFTYVPPPTITDVLNIPERSTARASTFVVDLNVLFDAVQNRPRSSAAGVIMQAAFKNYIRIAISRELKNELTRTANDATADPMLKMASHFWTLEIPPKDRVNKLSQALAPEVFPERHSQGILKVQDKSDLIHLITAIDNKAAGFVTSENKILAASDYLRMNYGLEVISLHELEMLVRDDDGSTDKFNDVESFADNCIVFRASDITDPTIQNAIKQLNVASRFFPQAAPKSTNDLFCIVVTDTNSNPIGFAWWTNHAGPTPKNDAFVTADENSAYCEGIVDFLCDQIIQSSCAKDTSLILLLSDHSQTVIRKSVLEHGFKASSGNHHNDDTLKKVCVGQPLHRDNWGRVSLKISDLAGGIKLPKNMPLAAENNGMIKFEGQDGTDQYISQQNFEHLLAPTVLISKDREGVIVPITRSWADDLFGTHDQNTLFGPPEAIARRERVYFSRQTTLAALKPGRVILFYESGTETAGRKSVIAIGRITQSNVVLLEEIEDNLLRRGVIDKKTLLAVTGTGKQTVTFFDNIMSLNTPVPYKRLKELGCDNNLNFVTATPISTKQLETIIIEGQAHA